MLIAAARRSIALAQTLYGIVVHFHLPAHPSLLQSWQAIYLGVNLKGLLTNIVMLTTTQIATHTDASQPLQDQAQR